MKSIERLWEEEVLKASNEIEKLKADVAKAGNALSFFAKKRG